MKRWRSSKGGCGCLSGCGTFVFVFLVGGLLSLFNSVFGIGISVGVPFMQSNVTGAAAIGTKAKILEGLPAYTRDRLAGNQNFINQSGTITVGPAEGAAVFIIGAQPGAPAVDLYLVLRTPRADASLKTRSGLRNEARVEVSVWRKVATRPHLVISSGDSIR